MSNNNIKSSPLSENSSAMFYNSIEEVENDENLSSPTAVAEEQTPKSFFTATTPSAGASTSSTSKTLFTFEQRARSSSPAAQLSKHATDSREKRKSMFLDRIRNRREDKRDERVGDQILRMDYVRQQRKWAEGMARMAGEADAKMDEAGTEVEEEDTAMDVAEQPSPTEDKEIEALVSYLEEHERTNPPDPPSDDEYDQLFMELSASQQNDTRMDMS